LISRILFGITERPAASQLKVKKLVNIQNRRICTALNMRVDTYTALIKIEVTEKARANHDHASSSIPC
jgi:hypothetical protein